MDTILLTLIYQYILSLFHKQIPTLYCTVNIIDNIPKYINIYPILTSEYLYNGCWELFWLSFLLSTASAKWKFDQHFCMFNILLSMMWVLFTTGPKREYGHNLCLYFYFFCTLYIFVFLKVCSIYQWLNSNFGFKVPDHPHWRF